MHNHDESLKYVDRGEHSYWEVTNEYFFKMSRWLEKHSVIFSSFWEVGKPIIVENGFKIGDINLETACITFDSEGDVISFLFHIDYWNKLTDYDRKFIISHEMLHIILGHGSRFKQKGSNRMAANIAMDISINHMIDEGFRISRKKTSKLIGEDACWVDTIFKGRLLLAAGGKLPPTDKSFEYYYSLFPDNPDSFGGSLLDFHEGYQEGSSTKDIIDKLTESLGEEALEEIGNLLEKVDPEAIGDSESKMKGNSSGGKWYIPKNDKKIKKKKWETVIKRWTKKKLSEDFEEVELWTRENRRIEGLGDLGVLLPVEAMILNETLEKNKIEVWFFQDTSGSCLSYADRFFDAALSIPHDEKDKFSLKLFCFDTKVYPVDLEKKELKGFGGTSFSVLESFVAKKMSKENVKSHPEIFVITDGFGDEVRHANPSKWHWFLTEHGSSMLIDKKSKIYKLADYE